MRRSGAPDKLTIQEANSSLVKSSGGSHRPSLVVASGGGYVNITSIRRFYRLRRDRARRRIRIREDGRGRTKRLSKPKPTGRGSSKGLSCVRTPRPPSANRSIQLFMCRLRHVRHEASPVVHDAQLSIRRDTVAHRVLHVRARIARAIGRVALVLAGRIDVRVSEDVKR